MEKNLKLSRREILKELNQKYSLWYNVITKIIQKRIGKPNDFLQGDIYLDVLYKIKKTDYFSRIEAQTITYITKMIATSHLDQLRKINSPKKTRSGKSVKAIYTDNENETYKNKSNLMYDFDLAVSKMDKDLQSIAILKYKKNYKNTEIMKIKKINIRELNYKIEKINKILKEKLKDYE